MKRVFLHCMVICAVTITMNGQVAKSNKEKPLVRSVTANKFRARCTSSLDGLVFCIDTPVVSAKFGKSIPVAISARNTTGRVAYLRNFFDEMYEAEVLDSKQNRILSRKEQHLEHLKQLPATNEITPEMIAELPFGSTRLAPVPPLGKISTTFNLADFYDFKKKGKYKLTIRKREASQPYMFERKYLLGSIEIDVK